MNLSHYTNTPPKKLVCKQQKQDPQLISCFTKPEGLWVSVDGDTDWPTWCKDNDCDFVGKLHYRVTLVNEPKMLVLSNHPELEDFTKTFGKPGRPLSVMRNSEFEFTNSVINWQRVAELYHGIIIAPYVWSARMELNWYYGWDCASGCIWDTDAIADVTYIGERDGEQSRRSAIGG